MKVKFETFGPITLEGRDYRQKFEVKVNEESKLFVCDGEPEDSNLSRDFNDVWKIEDLMKMAYEAGKAGDELSFESVQVEEE